VSFEAIERDMQQRDLQDRSRALAPLKAAADAVVIDSTELTIDQVVDQMLTHVRGVLDRG
jgi:cytidylate kinase